MDIIPELGAMVYQIGLDDGSGTVVSILSSDLSSELIENPWFRGRILFPFNDRIPRGKYNYGGREFQLPINSDEDHSSIHGLVYNRLFTETECELCKNEAKISYSCSINRSDFESYPFAVELKVIYTITPSDFSVSYAIISEDKQTLPFALGWHPYFSLSQNVNNLTLRSNSSFYVDVDKSLNPTGEINPVKGTVFDFSAGSSLGNMELDLALTAADDGKTILQSEKYQLFIFFDPQLFPYTQFFIPPDRGSIAIEPITAATNSFNIDGLGRIDLPPGDRRSGTVKISLNRLG